MKIVWKLYEDDGVTADDPLGSISITGDDGKVIAQEATYLDSWFEALLSGVRAIKAGEEQTIEMVEEPDPLELEMKGARLSLTHDATTILADPLEAIEEIQRQASRFLVLMQTLENWESNPTLAEIERYLSV